MSQRALTVEPDGTLRVERQRADDPTAIEAAVSAFADRTSSSETWWGFRLCAASIWRARRQGLSLDAILQTLETHSTSELPAKVRADIALWSQQLDRLSVEADQSRLVLRSPNPLAITAVMRHRTLGDFVTRQLNATTAELRAEAYPDLLETFDACRYPVMDRVPKGWQPGAALALPVSHQARPVAQPPSRPAKPRARRAAAAQWRRRPPQPCQATTRAGRLCKNRAQPGARLCHVHAPGGPEVESVDRYLAASPLLHQDLTGMLERGLLTLPQVAVARVVALMGIGLGTWLLSVLLRWCGMGGPALPLPRWVVAGVALVATCGLAGRVVIGVGLATSLAQVGLTLLSILLDCLHKEGLIVNLCFVVIPVLLPAWGLAHYGWALGWVFVCFPVGLIIGQRVYTFLDTMSA